MPTIRAFTLIELLIVVAIIAILAAIAVPNFLEAQVRSKVSRAQSDMRSMAAGLESYYVDSNQYPAMTLDYVQSVDAQYYASPPVAGRFARTFRTRSGSSLGTLTTPVAYLTSHFPDVFADIKGTNFRYFSDTQGWILSSWGPDVDQGEGGDLLMHKGGLGLDNEFGTTETIYTSNVSQPSLRLLTGSSTGAENGTGRRTSYTYDPTNGVQSEGEVWRVRQ